MQSIEDLDYENEEKPLIKRPSISLLLGAGFSAPMGYLTGPKMNGNIMNFDSFSVGFKSDGLLIKYTDEEKSDCGIENQYQTCFEFCKALIKEYSRNKNGFDYEKFMDFILMEDVYDNQYCMVGKQFLSENNNYKSLVEGLPNIYIQMVYYLLKDVYGNVYYDDSPIRIGEYNDKRKAYNGFLGFLCSKKKDFVINVHTLNHDLLFESFNRSGFVNEDISDGFDEFHSPYYGELMCGEHAYTCRLERFTSRYFGKSIRLYKLHGSINYAVFHKKRNVGEDFLVPQKEIKLNFGINPINLLCEKKRGNRYDNDFAFYHPDFLTGTTSKMCQYSNKVFYEKMFRKFRNNLRGSDALIIIGYGGKDEGINEYLLKYFDYKNKPTYIVDKCVFKNEKLLNLANLLNAQKMNFGVEDIVPTSFKM